MSRRTDRTTVRLSWFTDNDTDDETVVTDPRLTPGLSIDGQPSYIAGGDTSRQTLQIRCHCGAQVGMVFRHDRAGRNLPTFYYVETQLVEDPDARPVRTRTIARLLDEPEYITECAVHGRMAVDGDPLRNATRRADARIGDGRTRMSRFVIPGR